MDASSKMSQISSAASYAASGSTVVIGTMTSHDVAAIGGLLLALATFCVNTWYKRKHFQLALEVAKQGKILDERHADP